MDGFENNIPLFDFGIFDTFDDFEIGELDEPEAMSVTAEITTNPSSAGEPEKSRFLNLSENDLQKILDDKQSKKTKKNTNWCISTFKGGFNKLKNH